MTRNELIEALDYAAARLQMAAAEFRRGDADAGKREMVQATEHLSEMVEGLDEVSR